MLAFLENLSHRYLAPLAVLLVIVGCTGAGLQTFSKHDISFEVSNKLRLEEFSLDLARQIFGRGPSGYDQGVVTSSEKNFILEWVYEPQFTPELARAQVLNGPAFFESTDPAFRASIASTPLTKRISSFEPVSQRRTDFEVTFAEMELVFQPGSRAAGIIATWQCLPSQRAIIFLAVHKQPKKEMERFIGSFFCR